MRKFILLLMLSAFCFANLNAQTYSCKVDLTNDDSSNDRAFDQVLLPTGNRMITGLSYSNINTPNIFLMELDAVGNLIRQNAYPMQGNISNIEMVYDADSNEFVLFFDENSGGSIDIYLLRINASNLMPILKHGPLMSNEPGSFSWEYAIEILYEPASTMYPSGSYVLLANRQIPVIRKSYIVTIDKLSFAALVEELKINGTSDNVIAFDIIRNPFTLPVWGCTLPGYAITGSFNNDAFIANYCSSTLITTAYDIDNNPSTSDIGKKITVAGNSYFIAGENTYGTLTNPNGNIWLADIFLDASSPTGHQLNGATIYNENINKPETLIDLDYKGGFLYLTGKYNIGIVSPTGVDPNLNYISKLDLNRSRIWDREYLDAYNQGSKVITDIEVDNGAINSIGHLIFEAVPAPPGSSLDYDIDINKTDLNGELSDICCYKTIIFTPTIANPTINYYADGVSSISENVVDIFVQEVPLGFSKECCSEPMPQTNPNNCLVFDRSTDSQASASSTILNNINTQDFTFEAWISGNETDQDTHPIIFSNRTTGNIGTMFGLHNAWPASGTFKLLYVQFGLQNYFVVDNGIYNQSLLDGDCHHVAITRAGNTLTFFIDGQIIGTRTVPATVNLDLSSVANLTIGQDHENSTSFNGSITDIRIWSRARTQFEIASNRHLQLAGIDPNLEANWLMDEGAGQVLNDNSNNNSNAVLGSNGNIENIDPMWDANCCVINCLVFDRTLDSRASTSSSILNNINTQDFTFEAWISGNETDQDTHPIIFSNRTTGNIGTMFGLHNAWPTSGTFKLLYVQFGQQNYFVVDNGTYNQSLLDGDCHHVAITRTGNTLTFFIDGQITGTRTVPGTVNLDLSSVANLTIGKDQENSTSFNGSISDVRIWSVAKTQFEIVSNMYVQLAGNEANLEANWLMDEGVGQVLNDNSNNGNNAVLGSSTNIENIDPIWDINCCDNNAALCPPIIVKNEDTIPATTYHAAQTVQSAGSVVANTTVDFKAGLNISLKSGFSVEASSNFSAYIEPCEACNDCIPTEDSSVSIDDGNLVISWNGADNANYLSFNFYNDEDSLIHMTEYCDNSPLVITPNNFPTAFSEIFELDILVNCGFQEDCYSANCELVTPLPSQAHKNLPIIMVCDDEPG